MRGYIGINEHSSACVRFVRSSEIDAEDIQEFISARSSGINISYVDWSKAFNNTNSLFNEIAKTIPHSNYPYGPNARIELMDDLIGLSTTESGLLLLIDNADSLFEGGGKDVFDLIELFLIQFRKWYDQGKPCHLCFQMERSQLLADMLKKTAASHQ